MNLTLAAFYMTKPPELVSFITRWQDSAARQMGDAFRPYALDQVHATIVGLEGRRTEHGVINSNYFTVGTLEVMDLEGALHMMKRHVTEPIRIQLGGYRPHRDYGFESRGAHPHDRSFSITRGNVVTIGWPTGDPQPSFSLDALRRAFNRFGILHKYHQPHGGIDNDFFMVIGKLRGDLTAPAGVVTSIRAELGAGDPVHVSLSASDIALVAYADEELPVTSSVRMSMDEALRDMTRVTSLYASDDF